MKKLSLYVFFGLLVFNTSFAKEIKITHKDENSISITRSIWSESEMFEIAGKHCAQYKKYGFTFGVFNKKGVPDDKGKPTRLYHCSKKYLAKSPLTGDDNIHWSNHESYSNVVEKTKKKKKIVKKEKIKKQKEIVKTEVESGGAKVKLQCKGILERLEGDSIYLNFDEKTIEVIQGSGGNKLSFKVKRFDETWIISHLRSLLKGDTSYDTHISDWNEWDTPEHKYHLYQIQIDRIEGLMNIMVSKKPYKKGKTNYKLEPQRPWGMTCEKYGILNKKF